MGPGGWIPVGQSLLWFWTSSDTGNTEFFGVGTSLTATIPVTGTIIITLEANDSEGLNYSAQTFIEIQ